MTQPSTDPSRRSHVKGSMIPVALIAAGVVAVQLGIEFSIPAEGPPRAEALTSPVWAARLVSATLLSVAALLLLRGLYLDRRQAATGTDRLVGEYVAAGLLTALVGVFVGAAPAFAIGWLLVLAYPVLQRNASDGGGTVARDVRITGFAVVAANLLPFGVRELYATYQSWTSIGYGATAAQQAAFVSEHGGTLLVGASLVVAAAGSLVLPLMVWRHRRRIGDARGLWIIVCLVLAGTSVAFARNWVGLVVAFVSLVGVLGLGRRPLRRPASR